MNRVHAWGAIPSGYMRVTNREGERVGILFATMRIFRMDSSTRNESSHRNSSEDEKKIVTSPLPKALIHSARDEDSEALLNNLFQDYLLSAKVEGVLEKLKYYGAFHRDGEDNVFARASKAIVDTLAKHWTATRGAEVVTTAVVSNQLADKLQKHKKFVEFLAASNCFKELYSGLSHSLQIIMEHSEKLAAMIQLRKMQNEANHIDFSGEKFSRTSSNINIASPTWDLIQLAGERARKSTVLLMERDNAEVFYSRVSEIEELYHCLEDHLESFVNDNQQINIQIQRICELANLAISLICTAINYKEEHRMWYPSQDVLIPWYCKPVVRNGLWRIASWMIRMSNRTPGIDSSMKYGLYSHLESLAEVFLDAYYVAIECDRECKDLLGDYCSKRDELLNNLYQLAKSLAESKQASRDGMEQPDVVLGKLISGLLSLAKQHECYQVLWSICCDTNNSGLLRQLMHESAGPKGGFSCFVFEQLYGVKQFPELLRLGEEFPEMLLMFLRRHAHLLWLHQLFLLKFLSASETLHTLALSQYGSSISDVDQRKDPNCDAYEPTLQERRQLLNLSKIAAVAGGNAIIAANTKRIDADLKILQVQEDILTTLSDEGRQKFKSHLSPPKDLIELCLSSENLEVVLRAFDVFAYTTSSFRECNVSLLEECWRNAINQDDWVKSHETCEAEGWSDEDTFKFLRATVLFQAARRCYGPDAETYEGEFEEVLPLKQNSVDDSVRSVEMILMEHEAYRDAGRLMRLAVMLGGVQSEVEQEFLATMQ